MDSDMMHWHFDYVRLAWDAGFFFGNNKHIEKLDYSTIGLVDIERISHDRDYATIEKHIPTIINFTLQEELSKVLEPTFVKLFKLGQLSVEYLQFCKKYLDNTVILLKKELNDRQTTCDNLKKDCDNMNEYINNLKKKNKDLKIHLQLLEAQNLVSFDCPHCNKIFSSGVYLEAHINRRHTLLDPTPCTNMQIEADKLQMEIKELKERLNSSERFEQSSETVGRKNDISNKLELHRQHVESELEAIRAANSLKYEELSETMLRNLQAAQKGIESDKVITCEGATQTESNVRYVDSYVNTEADNNSVDTMQEIGDIKNIAEQHLKDFAAVLEQKVSNNLAHLETKLETLINKCSAMNCTSVDQTNETSIVTPNLKTTARKQDVVITSGKNPPVVRPRLRNKFINCAENTMYSGQIVKENITFIKPPQTVISSSESSTSESESESVSSEEAPESSKPTAKASTLRNRSLTSLRKAVDDDVTEGLAKELEYVLNQRLQAIGVSPEWTGIPKQSFEQALKMIHHQNKTIYKHYPNYNNYRESILLQLKSNLSEILSKNGNSKPNHRFINNSLYENQNVNNQQNLTPQITHSQIPSSDLKADLPAKQSFSPTATKLAVQTGKKRVLFDLDTEESSSSVENKPVEQSVALAVTGSTTSVASSVLDESHKDLLSGRERERQRKLDERAKQTAIVEEDVSDWDISDILAN